MESGRLNSPTTCTISLEVLGHEMQFAQDPNSQHHGTTVWDASMVFAKFLEKSCRKGRFSPSKLKGKRVIELGSGCGVAGFGMALLGCDVLMTDQSDVLPLLKRNVERNTSTIMHMNTNSDSFGSIQVAELSWGNEDHIKAAGPPFDYVIGTDVVYSENLLEPLFRTIIALSSPKTTIMLGYEMRSTNVHDKMLQLWKQHFEVKTVSKSKMDDKYQDPSIQLYIMGLKSSAGCSSKTSNPIPQQPIMFDTTEIVKEENHGGKFQNLSKKAEEQEGKGETGRLKEDSILMQLRDGNLSEWEKRRYGTIAARLLRDVKIDVQLKK